MTGSCSARQTSASNPTFDIFVTGEEPSDYDYYIKNQDIIEASDDLIEAQNDVGTTATYAFYHFEDALVRAKELAAQYDPSITVEITIHLFKNDHYILWTRGGSDGDKSTLPYYTGTQFVSGDGDNLNYELKIKPLLCEIEPDILTVSQCYTSLSESDQVTIYNKKKERFRMDVPVTLTLENVAIDSLDSILHTQAPSTSVPTCLSSREQCCSMTTNSDGVTVTLESADADSYSC